MKSQAKPNNIKRTIIDSFDLYAVYTLAIAALIISCSAMLFDIRVLFSIPFVLISLYFVRASHRQAQENKKLRRVMLKSLAPYMEEGRDSDLLSTFKRVLQAVELSYELIPRATTSRVSKNHSVQKVIEVIQNSLAPMAIRIILFDSDSELSSRRYLVGYPRLLSSDEDAPNEPSLIRSMPLSFGGRRFGNLDLEFKDKIDPSRDFELQVGLVTAYCSILLMNDVFSKEFIRLRSLSEETLRAKTGFLATLSHEIRGPLGVILNSVELISDGLCGEVTEMQKDALGMVKKSSSHLMDLVNDVLDYAKVESGAIDAKPVTISVHDLLSDMAAVVRVQALKKNQKLIIERGDERVGVVCDKRHLRQILINLLTNAIKYTPEGGMITVGSEVEDLDTVRIFVSDTGVGIPPEQKSRVFAPFERVEDDYSSAQIGTGLGMALTKRLVEGNHGIINFISEVGEGSTFWVDLPLAEIEKIITEEHDGREVVIGNGEQLLLLEQDIDQLAMFSKSLEQRGFKVTAISSPSEAISLCRKHSYASLIIEIDSPDFNAAETIMNIRSLPMGGKLPIIVMSGKAFSFDIENYLKLGVDRCLAKPFSLSELSVTIRRLLDEVVEIEESVTGLPQVH